MPEMNFSVHIFVWYIADNGLRVPIIAHTVKARCTNFALNFSKIYYQIQPFTGNRNRAVVRNIEEHFQLQATPNTKDTS